MLKIIVTLLLLFLTPLCKAGSQLNAYSAETFVTEISATLFGRISHAVPNERPQEFQSEDYLRLLRTRYERSSLSALRNWEAKHLSSGEIYQLGMYELSWLQQNSKITGRLPSRVLLDRVARSTLTHPVVGVENIPYYDPRGNIRFCFGVSTYVHELLLRLSFPSQAIMKAFVIGPGLWRDGQEAFHQSTIVLADDGQWYAVDQFFANAQPVKEWFQFYWRLSLDKKLRLYITDAGRFTPDIGTYDSFQMGLWHRLGIVPVHARRRGDVYRGYFRNLYEWLARPVTEDSFDQ